MKTTLNKSINFQIKPITQSDKARVCAISAQLWDGDDYIPFVFDEWVKGEESDFTGLWVENQLIAYNRLVYLTAEDAWLEGLRKDQDCPYKGVAQLLFTYHLNNLQKKKQIKSLRLSTYFDNTASIILHERWGFKKILELSLLVLNDFSQLLDYEANSTILDKPQNLSETIQFIQNSTFNKHSLNFMVSSWTTYPVTVAVINKFLDTANYHEIRVDGRIVAAAIFSLGKKQKSYWINFIEAENEKYLKELMTEICQKAKLDNINTLELTVPDNWWNLEKYGFHSWERKKDFWLYEYAGK